MSDESNKVRLSPVGRVSFPYVYNPREAKKNADGTFQKPKYDMTLIFDDSSVLKEMKALAVRTAKEKWPKLPASAIAFPFKTNRDKIAMSGTNQGEIVNGYDNAGEHVAFRSEKKPKVVGLKKDNHGKYVEIPKESGEFYAGCFAHVSYTCYATANGGTNRVCFSLENVQKLKDGEGFGATSSSPDDDFANVDTDAYLEDLEIPEDADLFA